jgi:ABC-type phosphate transport system substrate-binding protein
MKSIILAGLVIFVSQLCSAEIVVIVHPSNSNALDATSVSHIFLGKSKSFPDGSTAIPINQPEDSAISIEFAQNVLSKSPSQLKAYWSKLLFTGQGRPPKEVSSEADVIKLVADNPNTIGYIQAANVTGNVKVAGSF